MLDTYSDLVSYFETLPTSVTALKGVTVGADEDVMNLQNSRIVYPHLLVDTPDATFARSLDDNPTTRYSFSLYLVTNEPLNTRPEANGRLSAMLRLAEQIWARIEADAEDEGLFDLVLADVGGQPIERWTGDNLYGWRIAPVQIELPRCECDC